MATFAKNNNWSLLNLNLIMNIQTSLMRIYRNISLTRFSFVRIKALFPAISSYTKGLVLISRTSVQAVWFNLFCFFFHCTSYIMFIIVYSRKRIIICIVSFLSSLIAQVNQCSSTQQQGMKLIKTFTTANDSLSDDFQSNPVILFSFITQIALFNQGSNI